MFKTQKILPSCELIPCILKEMLLVKRDCMEGKHEGDLRSSPSSTTHSPNDMRQDAASQGKLAQHSSSP